MYGGCPFACINAGRSQKAKVRLEEHQHLFDLLWEKAVEFMVAAREFSAVIAFEWPTRCEYWERTKVRQHMRQMQYRFIQLHGCMFGLCSVARATKGLPIKKPWTVATDCLELIPSLSRRCLTSDHRIPRTRDYVSHAPCAGVDTKLTKGYTDELAVQVHLGHRLHVYGRN